MIVLRFFFEIILGFCAAIRPLFGSRGICLYPEETCQQYIFKQLSTQPIVLGLWKSTQRIFSCNFIYVRFIKRKTL